MKRGQVATLWAGAAGLGALAALSAVGAHLGSPRAAALFHSAPMAAIWGVLAAALLAGPVVVLSARPIRNAGLLAAYGGGALVLLGAMLGSVASLPAGAAGDRGLGVVYAGFVMLAAGLVWQMWVRPGSAYLRKRGSHGHQD
jgi:hypothetical protein